MSSQKRDDGLAHEGPQRTSPYPLSRLAPVHDLVDVAKRIAEADAMIGAVASGKLHVIREQIRALQDEARSILAQTQRDLDLHRARCSFVRRPGQIYHLYRRPNGELWFSMIAPHEWHGEHSNPFEGSYRLELDQSWTRVEEGEASTKGDPSEHVSRLLRDE